MLHVLSSRCIILAIEVSLHLVTHIAITLSSQSPNKSEEKKRMKSHSTIGPGAEKKKKKKKEEEEYYVQLLYRPQPTRLLSASPAST